MNLLGLFAILPAVVLALDCHPEGPIVPKPRRLDRSSTFQQAVSGLTKVLDDAFGGKIKAGFDIQNTSVSIGIVSFDQAEPDVPVWEYHHLSSANVNGTKSIGRHSQYLVGSISKAITDSILVRSGIDFDDPVTKYLPSLANKTSLIPWENITLGAIAGQVAGLVPNYGFSEFYYLKEYFEYLGFPHIDNSSYPECGVTGFGTGSGCNKEQFLQGMLTSSPVAPPQGRSVYSNIAFTLLMYAVEVHTGKNFTQLMREFSVALKMPSTRPSPGADSLAVIPSTPNNWGSDYGDGVAGGGMVSTVADLSSFMHAILSRFPEFGTETEIRAWLKPHTFIGATGYQGSPWEIFRPPPSLLFPPSSPLSHPVTITGKDGVAYGYRARISLLDNYGLGLVLLTAGDQTALPLLFGAVLSTLVPAIDATAREQAEADYTGSYTSTSNVTVKATVSLTGPTLTLTTLSRNGSDILAALASIFTYSLAPLLPGEMSRTTGVYNIYPAEVYRSRTLPGGRKVVEEDWRFQWGLEEGVGVESDLPGRGISLGECKSWKLVDWLYYGGEAVDRVVFVRDGETGEVVGIEVPVLRTGVMLKGGVRGEVLKKEGE